MGGMMLRQRMSSIVDRRSFGFGQFLQKKQNTKQAIFQIIERTIVGIDTMSC